MVNNREYFPGDEVELLNSLPESSTVAKVVSTPHDGKIELELSDGKIVTVSLGEVSGRLHR